jgi:hypothetical protein
VLRNFFMLASNSILMLGLMAAVYISPGGDYIHATDDFIYDSWLEEPNLRVSYIWNLYERRDGWYIDNWSDDQLTAVDTFEFGMREVFKAMNLSDIIDAEHNGDAWIQLYNVATNDPDGSHEFPPHINVMSFWGEAGREYRGGINGHFYATDSGRIDPAETWYAWHVAPDCVPGERNPGINVWVSHVDRNCAILWEKRVTDAGEIEVRRGANASIYTVRSTAPSDVDILRDGERIRSVHRVFHNAWIDYPAPYPDGIAKVIWEIRDYEANLLTTETIIANPDTGHVVSHERLDRPLDGSTPEEEGMIYLPHMLR